MVALAVFELEIELARQNGSSGARVLLLVTGKSVL
jgi:hypothetical protein